jgi:hypothetical protein
MWYKLFNFAIEWYRGKSKVESYGWFGPYYESRGRPVYVYLIGDEVTNHPLPYKQWVTYRAGVPP